jgi:hypothetical protein
MYLVYITIPDVIFTYTNFLEFNTYPVNYNSVILTFALHFYHIAIYYKKLRFDDWLHHILMIFVALPLGLLTNAGSLLGHSLFFLTGLPGGIDYFFLLLVKNKIIHPITEKKINNYINLWLRAPGCIAHTTLSLISLSIIKNSYFDSIICFVTSALTFWNGIYFMNQVVINYTLEKNKLN